MVFYERCGSEWSVRFADLEIALALIFTVVLCGCSAGYKAYSASGGGTEGAVGEQHDTPYSAKDTLVTTEDVLRGEGVLFDIQPDDKLETLWRPADKPAGMFASAFGVNPQYRYIIEIVPTGQRTSRIVANVETQDIADDEIASYLPSKKLNLFAKFDQLAGQFPPPSNTPRHGGVNFAVLPGEDLRALAKRATGNEANWEKIAKDNGLTAGDLGSVQTIWVRNSLLEQKGAPSGDR
jgi:hypothetical protein